MTGRTKTSSFVVSCNRALFVYPSCLYSLSILINILHYILQPANVRHRVVLAWLTITYIAYAPLWRPRPCDKTSLLSLLNLCNSFTRSEVHYPSSTVLWLHLFAMPSSRRVRVLTLTILLAVLVILYYSVSSQERFVQSYWASLVFDEVELVLMTCNRAMLVGIVTPNFIVRR